MIGGKSKIGRTKLGTFLGWVLVIAWTLFLYGMVALVAVELTGGPHGR